ncbi:ribbon-helix-helix protein, CopG family [Caballeronia sp. LZ029]|uniref:ribbon-helix-helix protein, CopG family n=1 Tax=Caballeronia sp. LZ029 TaxID=3038564 RepID=UPI00045AE9C7|nr:ribbon-helix-helix protein, CopG family [Caballeronia sp. LZ029]KAK44823.1 CopG family transcriptional regulator [Caballeronia jiangsuensis]MDR5747639.1 ribbon-helix-helix protein, CopG family [Caballeronia sp. LZ029]
MGRILIDLPDEQIDELAALGEAQQRPRAAIIRDAISAYVASKKRRPAVDVFGLWEERKIDGLQYQRELREEW